MITLLANMAAMPPGTVEFMIHHVVETFQMSIARYVHRKKTLRRGFWFSSHNKGMKPTKIKKVRGETGQAAKSKMPERIASTAGGEFFIEGN